MELTASEPTTRVGVVVVHGIGEQRRFEHLDGQVRELAEAIRARKNAHVTVEILNAASSPFQADQDSWSAGPSVKISVVEGDRRVEISLHEVWWADVNEAYSLSKGIRFWLWGLSIWLNQAKLDLRRPTAGSVSPPDHPFRNRVYVRLELYLIAAFSVLAAASVGLLSSFAHRVLNLEPPRLLQTFVNYVSGVKLYSQQSRRGAGFSGTQDFLDTLEEPPRVSIRRRMIRTLMDMAEAKYERWYVLAHSLGAVVAFNGLMETAYAWPGYFTEERWKALPRPIPDGPIGPSDLVGPAQQAWRPDLAKRAQELEGTANTLPGRPVWLEDPRDVAYRSRIFRNFRGLLTFGAPLEKFAALWPSRVPLSLEPSFQKNTLWLNVYDPIDPVSGVLVSFNPSSPACCPVVKNIGYTAGPVLLLNHLQYFSRKKDGGSLSDWAAEWLICGDDRPSPLPAGRHWYEPGDVRHTFRRAVAWLWWIAASLVLLALGGIVAPTVIQLLTDAVHKIADTMWPHLVRTSAGVAFLGLARHVQQLPVSSLLVFVLVAPIVVGTLNRFLQDE